MLILQNNICIIKKKKVYEEDFNCCANAEPTLPQPAIIMFITYNSFIKYIIIFLKHNFTF